MMDPMTLPDDLPVPVDDGAAAHLPGGDLPPVALAATDGATVRLDRLAGRTVLLAFPRMGRPGEHALGGDENWNAIPGARGCTPQACSFRDEHARFTAAGARVLGISTQDTPYQREAVERLHLPYPLLSDERLELAAELRLPTFEVDGTSCSSASRCSCATAGSRTSSIPSSRPTAARTPRSSSSPRSEASPRRS